MKKYFYNESTLTEEHAYRPGCWVCVECPDEDDLLFLTRELHLPPSFLEDIADVNERPRTETEEQWLLTILRIPLPNRRRDIPFVTVPLGIIVGKECTVTICHYATELIPEFVAYARKKRLTVTEGTDLLLQLIHTSALWYLRYLEQINNDVAEAEQQLEKSIRNEDLLRLMKLQKTLVYFDTAIRGNESMTGRLKNILQSRGTLNAGLLNDALIDQRQAFNIVKVYNDILAGTMNSLASIISNNVNTIMKRMTSFSITLMLPTLVASFYGMNVDVQLAENPYAFWFIVLFCIAVAGGTLAWFRKIGWF